MIIKDKYEVRTIAQIKTDYEFEKKLASRLRNSSKEERANGLYTELYDQLFKNTPQHQQIVRKTTPDEQIKINKRAMALFKNLLDENKTFAEIGPGDCSLSLTVSEFTNKTFAVDVSNEITKDLNTPSNFSLIISDGSSIPLPDSSIDVVFSNQLMEHLHPDDSLQQLNHIFRVLKKNGSYICITPNKFSGPHDISKYFDEVATGFHLKEYSVKELKEIFIKAGFSKIKLFIGLRGFYIKIPCFPVIWLENILSKFPFKLRRSIANFDLFRMLLGIKLRGLKT